MLATSDVPGGVVNLLTGDAEELGTWLAEHADVDGIDLTGAPPAARWSSSGRPPARSSASSARRPPEPDWTADPGLARMTPFLETKTVWHPIGSDATAVADELRRRHSHPQVPGLNGSEAFRSQVHRAGSGPVARPSIVPIALTLDDRTGYTLWAPPWEEDGEEWQAFLGTTEDDAATVPPLPDARGAGGLLPHAHRPRPRRPPGLAGRRQASAPPT